MDAVCVVCVVQDIGQQQQWRDDGVRRGRVLRVLWRMEDALEEIPSMPLD